MPKQRVHNEWFRGVSLGGRKSCPCCSMKIESNESIWSWGQYVFARWNTVKYFCKNCFVSEVQQPLVDHAGPCGCSIELITKGGVKRPEWLTLESAVCEQIAA